MEDPSVLSSCAPQQVTDVVRPVNRGADHNLGQCLNGERKEITLFYGSRTCDRTSWDRTCFFMLGDSLDRYGLVKVSVVGLHIPSFGLPLVAGDLRRACTQRGRFTHPADSSQSIAGVMEDHIAGAHIIHALPMVHRASLLIQKRCPQEASVSSCFIRPALIHPPDGRFTHALHLRLGHVDRRLQIDHIGGAIGGEELAEAGDVVFYRPVELGRRRAFPWAFFSGLL